MAGRVNFLQLSSTLCINCSAVPLDVGVEPDPRFIFQFVRQPDALKTVLRFCKRKENSGGGDVELLCKTLQVEHKLKLFYFDLKENPRGRYLKISEKTSRSRSTIIVPLAVVWFVDLFNYYASGNEQDLYSKELQLDTKVFYFDVGENQRGRFLKVSEASVTCNRSTIIVPAGNAKEDGWSAFRDILIEINEASQLLLPPQQASGPSEHLRALSDAVGPGFISSESAQVTSVNGTATSINGTINDKAMGLATGDTGGVVMAKVIRAEQKRFFFDLGSNSRGQFLRISEKFQMTENLPTVATRWHSCLPLSVTCSDEENRCQKLVHLKS